MPQLLCATSEISEGQCKSIKLNGDDIFILRKDARVYAYRNSCPHLGIPLNWQADQFLDAEGELIQCATHGALFVPESGLCVSGPCTGQSLISCPVFERDGQIFSDA